MQRTAGSVGVPVTDPARRARDLGIRIGRGTPGPANAITDVDGVRVGHVTLISGDGALRVGHGPVRTGVTVILPHEGDPWTDPLFAGCHRLNGAGDLTGLEWVRESGLLTTPIGLTNTSSVGTVRDALLRDATEARAPDVDWWALPLVGETFDGVLNDIHGQHVRAEHVAQAMAAARASAAGAPVAEGNVGGGTGMICHEFKGGIGTASRLVEGTEDRVGVLVQANYGTREQLRIDGVRVGEAIPVTEVPSPVRTRTPDPGPGGSIIVIVATDAPLLPHQCERLAHRAALGIARVGGTAGNGSGDLILAFATGNRALPMPTHGTDTRTLVTLRMIPDRLLSPYFEATVEATEEAIVNTLLAARTMTGRDGVTVYGLDPNRVAGLVAQAGRA